MKTGTVRRGPQYGRGKRSAADDPRGSGERVGTGESPHRRRFVISLAPGSGVVRLRDVERAVRPPGVGAAIVRTLLLCLVVPAVVWDADGRGLHDSAAGTVIVRG